MDKSELINSLIRIRNNIDSASEEINDPKNTMLASAKMAAVIVSNAIGQEIISLSHE